jgi:prepilin-type N-terminal cleavage/methylation domain-containing protein
LSKKGFTLIEVMIGLIFLAIGLLAIGALQITSTRGNFFSNNLMQATYVAQDRLEFLKNLPFDSPKIQDGSSDSGTAPIPGVVFNWSYKVVANGDVRTINLTVTWNDGVDHNVSFSTIRSQ